MDVRVSNAPPIGVILPFAGAVEPQDYVFCDGREILRAKYSKLFGVIGTIYGAGDGSTTFNLPDMRGRTPIGLDNLGGAVAGRVTNATALNVSGGAETHTLTLYEMPSHEHSYGSTASGVKYDEELDGYNPVIKATSQAGFNQPHNNMQPYITVSYIIKIQ